MMAAEAGPKAEIELTNQQKYQRLREKMLVEVKLISHAGGDATWNLARIRETNKGGAFCRLENAHLDRFFHWSEVRPTAQPDKARPFGTFGEIAKGEFPSFAPPNGAKPALPAPAPEARLAALAPRQAPVLVARERLGLAPLNASQRSDRVLADLSAGVAELTRAVGMGTQPPPPPPKQAPVFTPLPPAPRPAATVTQKITVPHPGERPPPLGERGSRFSKLADRTSKVAPGDSELGRMVRDARLAEVLTQMQLAERINKINKSGALAYNSRISRIEFGKSTPTDDELVEFSEALGLDLDRLMQARSRDIEQRQAEEAGARAAAEKAEHDYRELRKAKDRERHRIRREANAAAEGRELNTRVGRPRTEVFSPPPAPFGKTEEQMRINRDRLREQRHAQAAAEGRVVRERLAGRTDPPEHFQPSKPANSVAPRAAGPSRAPASDLADLVEALIELVPMPLDAELRKRWFQCATELFRLSGL